MLVMEIFLLLVAVAILISFFAFREGKNTIPDEDKEYNTKYSALNRLNKEQKQNNSEVLVEIIGEEIENPTSKKEYSEPFIIPDIKMVYMSHGSKKYHKKECKFIRGEENPITVSEAENMGLTPCKVCKPDLND